MQRIIIFIVLEGGNSQSGDSELEAENRVTNFQIR